MVIYSPPPANLPRFAAVAKCLKIVGDRCRPETIHDHVTCPDDVVHHAGQAGRVLPGL